jgi:nitrite reductase/ring-hydroxylating ferredoxin subunit
MYVLFLLLLTVKVNGIIINFKNNNNLPNHKWYVVGKTSDFAINKAKKIIINEIPISIWRDKNDNFTGVYDICPHRGAHLSKGRIDKDMNCIVCPYHRFKYDKNGRMIQTPRKEITRPNTNFNLKTDIPYYKVINFNYWVYLYNEPLYEISPEILHLPNLIWHEQEGSNKNYRYVLLEKDFNMDAKTVTENSLNILHILEVHTFYNKKRPLPVSDKIEILGEGHVRAKYKYKSSKYSMAYTIFGIKDLYIENEYILPHYTVARVKFGRYINTIITFALPISKFKTRLFVKYYRNNWVYNFEIDDYIFDKITTYMMEKTLNKDKNVIDNISYEHRNDNFITKYDQLVKKYREDYEKL